MQALTFKRGVHPDDCKRFTADKPIEVVLPKENSEMFYPMSQHIGAPCEPIVAVGDYVKAGQKIAETGAFVSSPIFSSVSGTVKDIRPMLTPGGATVKTIVIENDGKFEMADGIGKALDYENMSNADICAAIKAAGVVGLGGAGFPTHIKLAPPPDKKIDYIIVNAAECEPYLTCDYRVMLEQPEKIIRGLKVMLKLHPGAKGVIGIENNKPEAIKVLSEMVKDIPNIEVAELLMKYPQGAEKQIIYAITKREVPSTTPPSLPADVGCIVDNVATVMAIGDAIFESKPLMDRVITVSGGAAKNPGNYQMKIGMKISDLIDAIGGFKEEPAKFIAGGPMMGPSMYTLDVASTKTTSGLLCFTKEEAYIPPERNCIRCGKCVEHCPMGLMPLELNQLAIKGLAEEFGNLHGMDCIECGSCSFECPAKRQLAQSIRAMKKIEGGRRAAAAAAAKAAAEKK